MRPVKRNEILDYVTYQERRSVLRAAAGAAKALRRFQVGRFLCFLFENRETVLYQVQEMMRVEQIVREASIQQELDTQTYKALIGTSRGPGRFEPNTRATMQELRAGNILARDLDVVIAPGLNGINVLGMNFLSRLQGWRVEDGTLICPYHGLTYDGSGACVRVPGQDDPGPIRIRKYPVEERSGPVYLSCGA